jgi:hypothetical protein
MLRKIEEINVRNKRISKFYLLGKENFPHREIEGKQQKAFRRFQAFLAKVSEVFFFLKMKENFSSRTRSLSR